jgi:hypothetical protein
MPPLDATAGKDDWITVPAAASAASPVEGKDDWITVPAASSGGDHPAQAAAPSQQSQIGADVNAAGQGLVSGTGAVIAGIGRQPMKAAAEGTSNQLSVMDAIDQGKDVPQDQDTIGYQFLSADQRAQARADFTAAGAEASKREPNAFVRGGTAMQQAAPSMFPVDPANEGRQTDIARMVGGVVPAVVAGAAGTAVGGPVGGVLASAAVVGSQTYNDTYNAAIDKGMNPDQADDAASKSAATQMVAMSLPISKVIPLIPVPLREGFLKTIANVGANFTQRGGEMAAGNTLSTIASNYVASQTYDPGRPVFNGTTGDAGIDGFLTGLVVHAGGAAVGAARAGISDAMKPPAATIADIGAAPDIDSAIAAAGKVAQGDTGSAPFLPPDQVVPAPSFVPPGSQVPADMRQAAVDAATQKTMGTRPAEIPPTSDVDPLTGNAAPIEAPPVDPTAGGPSTVPSWGDLFAARPAPTTRPDPAEPVLTDGAGRDAAVTPASQSTALSLIPKTSAEAKAVASAYYQKADQVGGTLLPEFTNKFIDAAESIAPQTPEGRAIAGDTAITGLVDRIQALRDEPITLQGAQEIDERLGDLIDKEFGLKGLSKEGHNLLDLQTTFRNMILDAGPADTANGTEGFEAIKQGRAAWSQAMKMMDFERILNRANQTDNPVTSIRSGIRTLLTNPARPRGYSPEEIEALKEAANRGALGSVLHVFGSRLAPLAVGAAGLSTGVVPGLIGAGVAHGITSVMRSSATALQMSRANRAMSVLGAGVPPSPP